MDQKHINMLHERGQRKWDASQMPRDEYAEVQQRLKETSIVNEWQAKAMRLDEVIEECGSFLANEETEFQAGVFLTRILRVAQGESEESDG